MKLSWLLIILCLYSQHLLANEACSSPLRVGIIAPLSGDFAQFGLGAVHAMELANQSQPGLELELLAEDNRTCESGDAITAFHKLVDIDHVGLLVTFCTAAAQAVLGPAKAKGVPIIQLTEPGPDPQNYMLKLMPESTKFADYLADALVRRYKKVALVANTTEVNTGVNGNLPLFKKAFERLGGEIVLSIEFPDNMLDFRTIILRIRKSGADTVVPFIWPVPQMAAFLKQAEELNLWATTRLGGSFVFEFMYTELKQVYPQISKFNGLKSVNFLNETSQDFIEKYSKKFGEVPPQFADYAFDAATIIKHCGLERHCHMSKTSGVSGLIEFSSDGRRIGKFVQKQLVDGKFEVISASDLAPQPIYR